MWKSNKRSGDLLGSQRVEMNHDFSLPCRYVRHHTLVDYKSLPGLAQLALAMDDRDLAGRWLARCAHHNTYFAVGDECSGDLVPLSEGERVTVPIFVANELIKHGAASVISSAEPGRTYEIDTPEHDALLKRTVDGLGLSGDYYIDWLYSLC